MQPAADPGGQGSTRWACAFTPPGFCLGCLGVDRLLMPAPAAPAAGSSPLVDLAPLLVALFLLALLSRVLTIALTLTMQGQDKR